MGLGGDTLKSIAATALAKHTGPSCPNMSCDIPGTKTHMTVSTDGRRWHNPCGDPGTFFLITGGSADKHEAKVDARKAPIFDTDFSKMYVLMVRICTHVLGVWPRALPPWHGF